MEKQIAAAAAAKKKMAADFEFRAKLNLDKKWLRANLTSALRSADDLAHLWNHLLEDNEVLETTDNKLSPSQFTFIDESCDKVSSDTNNQTASVVTSDTIFNSWLWNPIPSKGHYEFWGSLTS